MKNGYGPFYNNYSPFMHSEYTRKTMLIPKDKTPEEVLLNLLDAAREAGDYASIKIDNKVFKALKRCCNRSEMLEEQWLELYWNENENHPNIFICIQLERLNVEEVSIEGDFRFLANMCGHRLDYTVTITNNVTTE